MNEKQQTEVELLSLALVREYLSRKGYKSTLDRFDKESMKREDSIQNRRMLAEHLGILPHVKKNKELGERALRSFLEMIVYYLLSSKEDPANGKPENNCRTRTSSAGSVMNTKLKSKRREVINLTYNSPIGDLDSKRVEKLPPPSENMSGGIGSRRKQWQQPQPNILAPKQNARDRNSSKPKLNSFEHIDTHRENLFGGGGVGNLDKKVDKASDLQSSDMVVLDDLDAEVESLDYHATYEEQLVYPSEPITVDSAAELKELVLGSASVSFNPEWMGQGFTFNSHPMLRYGLVQHKGGPCGILAAVQALILKNLLFESAAQRAVNDDIQQPTDFERISALASALSETLCKVSHKQNMVTVTLPSQSSKFAPTGRYRNDKLTETLVLHQLPCDHTQVRAFIANHVSHFTKAHGCVLFLYSAVLSSGLQNIRAAMDEHDGTLIGSHGYCTQEMVNLLLTGKAVSNVFDGDMELDSGNEHSVMLHGIHEQSDIGFLSLFEHYKSCAVGDNYKNPRYPIWVVCSESHFSVMFSVANIPDSPETSFDLYYYDELGRQDEEIRLTVDCGKISGGSVETAAVSGDLSEELVPPLEHCIRTKWKFASVSWNGTEPIL